MGVLPRERDHFHQNRNIPLQDKGGYLVQSWTKVHTGQSPWIAQLWWSRVHIFSLQTIGDKLNAAEADTS